MSTATLAPATWTATHHGEHLTVSGEMTMPTIGYKVSLKKAHPQGINPKILLLDKVVVPPTGIVPDHTVQVHVSFSEHTKAHYTEVSIIPDGPTIKVHGK